MVARVIPQRFFQVAAIAVLALAVGMPASAQSERPRNAPQSRTWHGNIAITTSGDGLWTFVTVAAPEEGMPLQVALVLQHLPPVPPRINATVSGSAELLSYPHQPPGVALRVVTEQGNCSFFRLGDYKGDVPRGCKVVDLAGIAQYDRTHTQNVLPVTHQEFVNQLLPRLEKDGPHVAPGGQALEP